MIQKDGPNFGPSFSAFGAFSKIEPFRKENVRKDPFAPCAPVSGREGFFSSKKYGILENYCGYGLIPDLIVQGIFWETAGVPPLTECTFWRIITDYLLMI